MKKYISIALMLILGLEAEAQKVIQLYDGKPKGSENWTWNETLSEKAKVIYNVSQPTITAYMPDPSIANGTAVIVAPGGAFHILAIDNEGIEVAKYSNSKGIIAFVLKYRLVHIMTDPADAIRGEMDSKKLDEENAPVVPLSMADGLTAIQYVRNHAKEMNISPDKIGFMGFSAGGTVAMSVVYNANDANRPNFVAPIYAYAGAIIGSEIPKVKTPIFVAVAADDQLGLMNHSIDIFKKWKEAKQPAELHVYQKGGHGFGMSKQNITTDNWCAGFVEWLKLQGYLQK